MAALPPVARESQLDGLRCLAFFAVFAVHSKPDLVPWGWGGVHFFFALSGFLITRILSRGVTGRIGPDLRRYYIRRTLRIFPLYYALIAIVGLTGQLRDPAWFLTYTYNIKVFLDNGIDTTLGHFWTLCVEEQFYLLYPILLLATPARHRLSLVIALIVGAVAFQIYAVNHWNIRAARVLLPYCGEDLLCGSVAGLIDLRRRPSRYEGTACFLAGPPLLVLGWYLFGRRLPLPVAFQDIAAVSLYSIGCSLMVFGASRTTARWLLWPLTLAPVAYLGRISYGLYAFHLPVLNGWYLEIPFGFFVPKPWGELALTIGLAALSWKFFEGPINRLKDRAQWRRPATTSELGESKYEVLVHQGVASSPTPFQGRHEQGEAGMGVASPDLPDRSPTSAAAE